MNPHDTEGSTTSRSIRGIHGRSGPPFDILLMLLYGSNACPKPQQQKEQTI